jgi:hypothetical protein
MATLKYTSLKGASLLSVAAIAVYATTAFAQSAKDACGPIPVIPLAGEEPQRSSLRILRWPNLWPRAAWRLSNTVLRTCTLCRCSAQMLWLSRRASDTFT